MTLKTLADTLETTYKNTLEGLYQVEGIHSIEKNLVRLASDKRVTQYVPKAVECLKTFQAARSSGDKDDMEFALIDLYLALHGGGHDYSADETRHLNTRRGLRCLPGGLLPILLARHLVQSDTVFADLGSGNGLQGLLLRQLTPHLKTVQIELASSLIQVGKLYQEVLEIEKETVQWFHSDIVEVSLDRINMIYLYRPARPVDEGTVIYQKLSEKIAQLSHPVTIVSVADCFGKYLDSRFSLLYENEFVSVFTN